MLKSYEPYYLGLDIGTNSVGWCVCNPDYHVLKHKGNAMWGVSLFDEAQQSAERRTFRTTRRRYARRKQRIQLLEELFAAEIAKTDPQFFLRRRESALWAEDRSADNDGSLLGSPELDQAYHTQYPTIHHLICKLMESDEPQDVRLVYIACAYLLAHRGHFLYDIDLKHTEQLTSIAQTYQRLREWFESRDYAFPYTCTPEEFGAVLTADKRVSVRERNFQTLLWNGKKPVPVEEDPVDRLRLVKLIAGSKVKLSDLFFQDSYAELEKNSISVAAADFDDTLEQLRAELTEDEAELLTIAQALYNWGLLVDMLAGKQYISQAKVAIYEEHQSDLKLLKQMVRKYVPARYDEVFRLANEKDNYVRYSGNLKGAAVGNIVSYKNCDAEAFCKYIRSVLKDVTPDAADQAAFTQIQDKLESNVLCPKQVTSNNRVIPYQLYAIELQRILERASGYLPFLRETDAYGSVADKVYSIMTFRIPYYVGPLAAGGEHAWIVRKAERIFPWNFDEVVDLDKSEEAFIRRMTAQCTYCAGEDVLPKQSLLYTKFTVLNEINNICINGVRLLPEVKQGIYRNLFLRYKKVTVKKIREYLSSNGWFNEKTDQLGGIDITVKSSLKPWLDFRRLMEAGTLSETDAEAIIERITTTTDRKRLKQWLKQQYAGLEKADIDYLSGLGYTDYGRLSRCFLAEIPEVDSQTGEIVGGSIIEQLWTGSENLMELLSQRHGFQHQLTQRNMEYYAEHPKTLSERMREMYLPTAVQRSVTRTLEIVKELRKLTGAAPEKIFVEMARDHTGEQKGQRKQSRKEQVQDFLKKLENTDRLRAELEQQSESALRSDKLYLYFMQLGRCMYSGEAIDLQSLGTDVYDIDHIFPRSKLKDDSLDNRVLVKSALNGAKTDRYPLIPDIQSQMHGFWSMLHKNGMVSDKKYERLTRTTKFTDEELAGFISRQIVETRQSTKAVATLLKEMLSETEIVYVKAGLVSDFRHTYDLLKCREVNDLHHAKDAYLNIVMGNVYHVKFTANPLVFIRENGGQNRTYSMRLDRLLEHDIERGGVVAWRKGETLEIVKRQMAKNNIRCVRYCYTRKGCLFNQNPERKAEGKSSLVERKQGLSVEKYGGYNYTVAACFVLVKYYSGKKCGLVLMPLEVMHMARYVRDAAFAEQYCMRTLAEIVRKPVERVEFPLGKRFLKINTLIEINGCVRVNLLRKDSGGTQWGYTLASSLLLDPVDYVYVKRLSGFAEKHKGVQAVPDAKHDKITTSENERLFERLLHKMKNSTYQYLFRSVADTMEKHQDIFFSLPVEQQVVVLLQMVNLLKTGRKNTCDLSLIGASKQSANMRFNTDLLKWKGVHDIRIIDQSATGLMEKKSANLLTL